MALIDWNEDEKEKDELFSTPKIAVTSVQDGAWQPAPSGANAPAVDEPDAGQGGVFGQQPQQQEQPENQENYLLSDQKAQVDEAKRQNDAAIEEARRQAAAAEAAEAAAAAEANAMAQSQNLAQEAQQPKKKGKSKYRNNKKGDDGFLGFLKGIGAGVQQGLGAVGDVAIKGGGVIGAIGKNDRQLVKHVAEVEKVRNWLGNQKDITGNKLIGTRDVEQNAADIISGRGDLQDYVALGGKSLQVGIDATMPFNPTSLAVKSAIAKGATPTAVSFIEKSLSNPAVRTALRDAGFFGGLQGVATGAQTYGQTGDIEEALKNATTDALIGGALQGTLDLGGYGLGTTANKALKKFQQPEQARIGEEIVQDANGNPISPQERELNPATDDGNISFQQQGEVPEFTPVANGVSSVPLANEVTPVADGVVNPAIIDGAPAEAVPTPVDTPSTNAASTEMTPVTDAPPVTPEVVPAVADGVVQPSQVVPAADPNMPVIRPEQVNDLQDARAGASQADEAIINQELQQIENTTPEVAEANDLPAFKRGYGAEPVDAPKPNEQLAVEATLRRQGYDDSELIPAFQRSPEDARPAPDAIEPVAPALTPAPAQALPENLTPVTGNSLPEMEAPASNTLSREQVAERLMPKLADSQDMKQRVATSVGMEKDAASSIEDILKEGKVQPRRAERVTKHFNDFKKHLSDYNAAQEANQRGYAEKGADGVDIDTSKSGRRAGRELGITTRRLVQEIKQMEGSRDRKVALMNNLSDLIGTRNANILTSAGLLERNIMQEITANTKLAIKNPVKTLKSTFNNGNIPGSTLKSELSHWADRPGNLANPVQLAKYFIGNTYRTGMIPTTILSNTRRGALRDELTQWAYKEVEGRELSSKEAHKLAGTAGNEMELLVNTGMGIDNGMTNRKQFTDALEEWKKYISTGDDGARAKYLERVDGHSSLADQMIAGLGRDDATKARGIKAMGQLIFPFVRTATNLMRTTVRQDLNPFAKSVIDEIRADQRGGTANALNLVKSKLVDYGIMTGAAALASSGVLAYNDGDEVDKPRGWSLKLGDDKYVPVRATSLELPLALAGASQAIASDIAAGKPKDWQYYAGMVTGSLPYIDQMNTTTGAVDSLVNGEDGGYAVKAYGVNTAKSFVPWSNNGIQPYIAGKKGESLNAKSVYDENIANWFMNTVRKSYDPNFYNSLKDSRDNAGRVRTVDNQGVVSNKKINDATTAEFNDRITDLVEYGRENGLGKNVKEMFNTYDTGKNNNFKSVQDAITFLDVEDGGKPDNAKKLEKNGKLTDLSRQIREGFYGDTGNDLLTLNGQNLKSDVSVPNKSGAKNSKLPISMQSIKNAVAQTDLPKDKQDRMYEISKANQELYNRRKAKEITYDQEQALKAKNEQEYSSILSGSKNYKKMLSLFDELDGSGFFNEGGLGSTKSGQTYLWNSLNALLGSKGSTPAANYPDANKGFTPWGRRGGGGKGSGFGATKKPGDRGNTGVKWSPVSKRQQAAVASAKYTPVKIKVKLGSEVKKDRTQNYADRSF